MKKYILDLEIKEITKLLNDWGVTNYRIGQVLKWVYQKKIKDFSECSDLPLDLREKLKENFVLTSLTLKNKVLSALDGTTRYDFLTLDEQRVSAVFLPQKGRNSLCISTQIGCPLKCLFCASGKIDFVRNLSKGEIIEQILQVEWATTQKIDGILLMGMGEPFLNYDNVISALKVITDSQLISLGRRHITVSTVGIIPMIERLSSEKLNVRLAISLHAPDDDIRAKLVSRKVPYSVERIIKSGFKYARRSNTRLTIEYILINGLNDTLSCARKLAKLINKFMEPKDKLQINLIPYNPVKNAQGISSPDKFTVEVFKKCLMENRLLAIIREPKGKDITSACGQLQ